MLQCLSSWASRTCIARLAGGLLVHLLRIGSMISLIACDACSACSTCGHGPQNRVLHAMQEAYLRIWFGGVPIDQIRRGNMEELMAYGELLRPRPCAAPCRCNKAPLKPLSYLPPQPPLFLPRPPQPGLVEQNSYRRHTARALHAASTLPRSRCAPRVDSMNPCRLLVPHPGRDGGGGAGPRALRNGGRSAAYLEPQVSSRLHPGERFRRSCPLTHRRAHAPSVHVVALSRTCTLPCACLEPYTLDPCFSPFTTPFRRVTLPSQTACLKASRHLQQLGSSETGSTLQKHRAPVVAQTNTRHPTSPQYPMQLQPPCFPPPHRV